ncbi:sugar transferase [Acidithiobacillus ferrooxidans]|jgi:undecaprenyl-phosphate galactose phosphotransferase|uniref:sugar transferase n=1 Tax=Acidithiobacillus ferrooxidans TaxID=920 RepID=UPI0002E810CC|nr:sugar transferase [Acidithiobacillus ferrooxidans]BDB14329.1 hypothetical protein ANFP_16490 [Acidithiobacillus ferrooxidans]
MLGCRALQTMAELDNPHMGLALEMDQWQAMESLVWNLGMRYPDLTIVPPLRGLSIFGLETLHFFSHEIFMLRLRDNLARPGPRIIKRAFDLTAASILVLLLSPLLLFLAWRIRRDDGGPVPLCRNRWGGAGGPFPVTSSAAWSSMPKAVCGNILPAIPSCTPNISAISSCAMTPA